MWMCSQHADLREPPKAMLSRTDLFTPSISMGEDRAPVEGHCFCRWLGGVARWDTVAGTLQLTLCAPLCRQGNEQGGHLFFWGGHLGDLHPGASSPERQPARHRVRLLQCLPTG